MYFRPSHYDKVIHQWRRRPFVRERFSCFLDAPVGFEFKINQTRRKISQAKAGDGEQLILSDMVSSKSANVLFSVSTDAGLKPSSITYLDGDFVSRVFRGNSEEQLSEWVHGLYEWVEESFGQHINPEKLFIFYPQRPSRDGKTKYVVFFVQLENRLYNEARRNILHH
jgi:hypothetical protein